MNTASLKNCKKLYELSGWAKTQNVWAIALGEENKNVSPWLRIGVGSSSAWREYPAYDAGYLLRKLPKNGVKYIDTDLMLAYTTPDGSWTACYILEVSYEPPAYFYGQFADTPEDALALLAIKLFEEGILTK